MLQDALRRGRERIRLLFLWHEYIIIFYSYVPLRQAGRMLRESAMLQDALRRGRVLRVQVRAFRVTCELNQLIEESDLIEEVWLRNIWLRFPI